jgi:3-methyladenine DNA glycosylase AlkC
LESTALKHMYNRAFLNRVNSAFVFAFPAFDQKQFLGLMPKLEKLEMKDRVRLVRDEFKRQLPADYAKALKILVKVAEAQDLKAFDLWPFTEFVQSYGVDHPQISLEALRFLTTKFTAEWAVRPFIKAHPKLTLKFLNNCALSSDEHLRRWASEGTRPRLPWGERLQDFVKDPKPALPILEKLKFDESLYVRKSVANHLNDIAKDHPQLVVKILSRWKKEAGSKHQEKIQWTIHRALRSLIKDGHAGALGLIGVSAKAEIQFKNFKLLQKKIRMGERVEFEFEIHSLSPRTQKLVVDYVIHFVKSNQTTAPKVFKLKTFEISKKASLQIKKSHHIKPITTRKYYAGEHQLEIQINGKALGRQAWILAL